MSNAQEAVKTRHKEILAYFPGSGAGSAVPVGKQPDTTSGHCHQSSCAYWYFK